MATELDEQNRVLSEVSHDLANQFHRAYYLMDLIGEVPAPDNEAAGPLLERLRETVEEIESMARGALSFVRPLDLRRLRVRLQDLTASLRQHAGMRSIELRGDMAAGLCEIDVDPAKISEALATLCRTATANDDSQAPVVVELFAGETVALRIYRNGRTGPTASDATDAIDARASKPTRMDLGLALSTRIARLHGGDIDIDDGEPSSLTLRLPLAARGG